MPDEIKPAITPKTVRVDIAKEPPKEIMSQTFTLDPAISSSVGGERITTEDKLGNVTPVKVVENEPNVDKTKIEEALKKTGEEDTTKPRDEKGQFVKQGEEKAKGTDDSSSANVSGDKRVETPKDTGPKSVLSPPKKDKTGEGKTREEVVKDGQPKQEVVKSIGSALPTTRDYAGFSPEEQAALKQMSNEAFDFTSKVLKQNKEFSKTKGESIYTHPEAYTLDPAFKTIQTQVHFGGIELQCYETALKLCKDNKSFRILERFDEKGQPVFSQQAYEPSAENEIELTKKMANMDQWLNSKRGEMQQFGAGYTGKVKNDLSAIETERARRFDWVTKPEILDYTVPIEMNDGTYIDRSIKECRDYAINLIPAYMRNHPVVEAFGDLFAALQIQGAELRQARQGQSQAEIKREEAVRGEPTSDLKPAAQPEAINGVREFSLKGLPT